MGLIINDKDKCPCGAYWNTNHYCSQGHPRYCKCGGRFKAGLDDWASRIRCEKCGDYYDL